MFRIIIAMSQPRQKIIAYLDGVSEEVSMHIAKCAMYQDTLGRYDHWIHELAAWISDGNKMTCKPGDRKLKPRDYEDTIFGYLGDGITDAEVNLHKLQRYNNKFESESYPYVEVDDKMIDRMYRVSKAILSHIVPILSSKNDFTLGQIEIELHRAIDPECLHGGRY